jgi:hypothetical protein
MSNVTPSRKGRINRFRSSTYLGYAVRSGSEASSRIKEQIMATQTVQQVVDYLKAHPDVAHKAMDYMK